MSHSCMNCCLAWPYVSCNKWSFIWNLIKERSHELGCELISRIIGKLFKALVIKWLPDQLIKETEFLRKS